MFISISECSSETVDSTGIEFAEEVALFSAGAEAEVEFELLGGEAAEVEFVSVGAEEVSVELELVAGVLLVSALVELSGLGSVEAGAVEFVLVVALLFVAAAGAEEVSVEFALAVALLLLAVEVELSYGGLAVDVELVCAAGAPGSGAAGSGGT